MKKVYIILIIFLMPCLILNIIEKDIVWIMLDLLIISLNLHSIQMEELKENRVIQVIIKECDKDKEGAE
jgi:hypothetical protein